jgi:outer membrane protein TolC
MRRNTDISEADYAVAVSDFRQTLYSALSDVENALAARQHDLTRSAKLSEAEQQASRNERLVSVRYKNGYVDLQTWLDAQETWRTTAATHLENRYDLITDTVTLFEALGGNAGNP